MADSSSSEEVKPEESERSSAILPSGPQKRADPEDSPASGAICHFELVRGTGDAEIARLAELQHGHVHLEQLRAAGIGRNALAHRVRTGRLHATLPCVYLVGRPQRTELGRLMAAALHFKGDALVYARAGAQMWDLLDTTQRIQDDDPIDVLLVGRNARQPRGVRIHRTARIARQDIRWRHGVPVTSPGRTILGLAATMDTLELEAVLSVAFGRRLVTRRQLEDVLGRNPHAKGIAQLRRLLKQTKTLHGTRSKYERKLLNLLRQAELPLPITNIKVAGQLVDAYWPNFGLVVEFDSWKYHRGRSNFETDRLRDQHLTLAGKHVMRITARQVDHTPYALIARIAATIANLGRAPETPY